MPEYQHSCFISYKHPPVNDPSGTSRHFWMEFIDAFQSRLTSYMTVALTIYKDDALQILPGALYPAELSQRLCGSACLIAILVPEYMESSWCEVEWKAMETLERERNVNGRNPQGGAIIPILFRGDHDKAAEFCGARTFLDFRHVVKPSIQLNNIAFRTSFEHIAQRVADLVHDLTPCDCTSFQVIVGEEELMPSFDDPNPLV